MTDTEATLQERLRKPANCGRTGHDRCHAERLNAADAIDTLVARVIELEAETQAQTGLINSAAETIDARDERIALLERELKAASTCEAVLRAESAEQQREIEQLKERVSHLKRRLRCADGLCHG